MAKEAKVTVTFSEVLKRSNNTIREERAERMGTYVKMAYYDKINRLTKEKMKCEAEIDNLMDMSASNVKTTVNRVDSDSFDGDAFVNAKFALDLRIHEIDFQLEILQESREFYS